MASILSKAARLSAATLKPVSSLSASISLPEAPAAISTIIGKGARALVHKRFLGTEHSENSRNYFDNRDITFKCMLSYKRLGMLDAIQPRLDALAQTLGRPLNILDVGSGYGLHANHLANKGFIVTAAEPVQKLMELGQSRYKENTNLTFVQDALPDLKQLNGRQFDFICSIAVLNYLPPEQRQASVGRILDLLYPKHGMFYAMWSSSAFVKSEQMLQPEEIHKAAVDSADKMAWSERIMNVETATPASKKEWGYPDTSEMYQMLITRQERSISLTLQELMRGEAVRQMRSFSR